MKKEMHFKNKEGYNKWLAYGHIHHEFTEISQPKVFIHGKLHKVKHDK